MWCPICVLEVSTFIHLVKGKLATYRMCTSRQSDQRDIFDITSESPDIVSHPLKQQHLIPKSQIQQAFLLRKLRIEEAQSTDTITKADSYKGLGEPSDHRCSVVHLCRTAVEGTTMDVNHDGDFLICRQLLWSEDVGGQAVFALRIGAGTSD